MRGALLQKPQGDGQVKRFLLSLALVGAVEGAANALPNAPEIIPAQGGNIKITPVYHGSMQIEYKGFVIQVDPFSAGDYSGAKKADLVLITHSHPDHLDLEAIASLLSDTAGTRSRIVWSPDVQKKNDWWGTEIKNGQTKTVAGIKVEAVSMYNVKRGPKPGQKFHPKGEFNGYILTLGGKRIYIAGDTEATPEMKALKNIDVAFLPMNLPYTMTPQEAAAGAKAFKPKVVYPYHYRFPFTKPNDNPQQFAKALEGSGIAVKIRSWYAHPAPMVIVHGR